MELKESPGDGECEDRKNKKYVAKTTIGVVIVCVVVSSACLLVRNILTSNRAKDINGFYEGVWSVDVDGSDKEGNATVYEGAFEELKREADYVITAEYEDYTSEVTDEDYSRLDDKEGKLHTYSYYVMEQVVYALKYYCEAVQMEDIFTISGISTPYKVLSKVSLQGKDSNLTITCSLYEDTILVKREDTGGE